MKFLLALPLFFIGGGSQGVGCRVTVRPTGWSEMRVLNPYTGSDPLTEVRIDVCAVTNWILRYENRTPNYVNSVEFTDLIVRMQVSFEPTFAFSFADFEVQTSNTGFTQPGFDGVVDFAGTSGYTYVTPDAARLFVVNAPVLDPKFFMQPFQVFVRASATSSINGGGAFTAIDDPSAGAGIAFNFNP